RTRGDGPLERRAEPCLHEAPPHTRGWTLVANPFKWAQEGSPAHAGMDRFIFRWRKPLGWLPRTRGDGPGIGNTRAERQGAPPHTRGWTPYGQVGTRFPDGSPAHAGMDRSALTTLRAPTRLPRTRGDGPLGVDDVARADKAPPHTRGWTPEKAF